MKALQSLRETISRWSRQRRTDDGETPVDDYGARLLSMVDREVIGLIGEGNAEHQHQHDLETIWLALGHKESSVCCDMNASTIVARCEELVAAVQGLTEALQDARLTVGCVAEADESTRLFNYRELRVRDAEINRALATYAVKIEHES